MFGSQQVTMFPKSSKGTAVQLFLYIFCIMGTSIFTLVMLNVKQWKYTQFIGLVLALVYNLLLLYTFAEGMFYGAT